MGRILFYILQAVWEFVYIFFKAVVVEPHVVAKDALHITVKSLCFHVILNYLHEWGESEQTVLHCSGPRFGGGAAACSPGTNLF